MTKPRYSHLLNRFSLACTAQAAATRVATNSSRSCARGGVMSCCSSRPSHILASLKGAVSCSSVSICSTEHSSAVPSGRLTRKSYFRRFSQTSSFVPESLSDGGFFEACDADAGTAGGGVAGSAWLLAPPAPGPADEDTAASCGGPGGAGGAATGAGGSSLEASCVLLSPATL